MATFEENLCSLLDHDWVRQPELFVDKCDRCGKIIKWLDRIATAMINPLKTTLNYQCIGRKLIQTEKLDLPGNFPIYDKDLPS